MQELFIKCQPLSPSRKCLPLNLVLLHFSPQHRRPLQTEQNAKGGIHDVRKLVKTPCEFIRVTLDGSWLDLGEPRAGNVADQLRVRVGGVGVDFVSVVLDEVRAEETHFCE